MCWSNHFHAVCMRRQLQEVVVQAHSSQPSPASKPAQSKPTGNSMSQLPPPLPWAKQNGQDASHLASGSSQGYQASPDQSPTIGTGDTGQKLDSATGAYVQASAGRVEPTAAPEPQPAAAYTQHPYTLPSSHHLSGLIPGQYQGYNHQQQAGSTMQQQPPQSAAQPQSMHSGHKAATAMPGSGGYAGASAVDAGTHGPQSARGPPGLGGSSSGYSVRQPAGAAATGVYPQPAAPHGAGARVQDDTTLSGSVGAGGGSQGGPPGIGGQQYAGHVPSTAGGQFNGSMPQQPQLQTVQSYHQQPQADNGVHGPGYGVRGGQPQAQYIHGTQPQSQAPGAYMQQQPDAPQPTQRQYGQPSSQQAQQVTGQGLYSTGQREQQFPPYPASNTGVLGSFGRGGAPGGPGQYGAGPPQQAPQNVQQPQMQPSQMQKSQMHQPHLQQQPVQQPQMQQSQMQQPPMQQPQMQQQPMQQPQMQQLQMQQPPMQQLPMQQPQIQQPPMQQTPMQQPPAHQQPMQQTSHMQQPPLQQQPMHQPPMHRPPMHRPPSQQPPMQQPSLQQPPSMQQRPRLQMQSYGPGAGVGGMETMQNGMSRLHGGMPPEQRHQVHGGAPGGPFPAPPPGGQMYARGNNRNMMHPEPPTVPPTAPPAAPPATMRQGGPTHMHDAPGHAPVPGRSGGGRGPYGGTQAVHHPSGPGMRSGPGLARDGPREPGGAGKRSRAEGDAAWAKRQNTGPGIGSGGGGGGRVNGTAQASWPAPEAQVAALQPINLGTSDPRPLLLFEVSGVLCNSTSARMATNAKNFLPRPGVRHLARLLPKFRLGVYTSAQERSVMTALGVVTSALRGELAVWYDGWQMLVDGKNPAAPVGDAADGGATGVCFAQPPLVDSFAAVPLLCFTDTGLVPVVWSTGSAFAARSGTWYSAVILA